MVLNWASGPVNDRFVNAQVLTGNSGHVSGSNSGASKETGEPSHSPDGNLGGKSVWYRWTAPGAGTLTLTTTSSNFDTVLAVYTGTAVNTLTALPSGKNDDVLSGVTTSKVAVHVTAGTIYRIAVDGYNSTGVATNAASGTVVLNWSFAATAAATGTAALNAAPVASPLTASSLGADAATTSVHLRFSGGLDPVAAADPTAYTVTVDGHAVPVQSAAYSATGHGESLDLPDGALRAGDRVVVAWKLLDNATRTVAGTAGVVAGATG